MTEIVTQQFLVSPTKRCKFKVLEKYYKSYIHDGIQIRRNARYILLIAECVSISQGKIRARDLISLVGQSVD